MSFDGGQGQCFRVEHRTATGEPVCVLGRVADVCAHHQSLVPFISKLLREVDGASGVVALVDETTGITVARRYLTHSETVRLG